MKITVYTTTDCQYCKQEKDYLVANKLAYEEKNLETNKEFLTEMMAISNNFAGTPVTRVEKDDGSIIVLKGFTKGEFDTAFGFVAPVSPTPVAETPTVEASPTAAPITPPPTEIPIVEEPVATEPVVPSPTIVTEPKSEELNSVLDKLEEKTSPPQTADNQPPITNDQLPTTPPSVPDFPDPAKTTV